MKYQIAALALGAGLCMAGVSAAEPYVDWTPTKGATEVVTIKVDSNHIDDYLTGLSTNWVQGQEMAKRRGVIDWYQVNVKLNGAAGANVLLISHYPSLANLEPDKARDQAMEAEALAHMSKEKGEALVAGYDKYRTFVSDDIWTAVEFKK